MANEDAQGGKKNRPLEILLVEDNEDDIELTLIAFRQADAKISIHAVRDGEDALNYMGRKDPYQDWEKYPRPDLILLDIRMPKMDGLEVLKKLKQTGSPNKIIPVIMLTSSKNESDIVESYRNGAASYLQKPVTMGEFVNLTSSFTRYWQLVTLATPHDD